MTSEESGKRMTLIIVIGVMLMFGGGLFWVISGDIDCQQAKNKSFCQSFKYVGDYAVIPMIGGIMLLPLGYIIFGLNDDKPKTNRSAISQ